LRAGAISKVVRSPEEPFAIGAGRVAIDVPLKGLMPFPKERSYTTIEKSWECKAGGITKGCFRIDDCGTFWGFRH
jgi:hypothetical protein